MPPFLNFIGTIVTLFNKQFRLHHRPSRGGDAEARWLPLNKATQNRVPRAKLKNLSDQSSLTQRLMRASGGAFSVEVVFQGWRRALFSERRLLGLRDREYSFIREVRLTCKGEAWVVARSIIPLATLKGKTRRLAYLGNKPLGGVLFKDPSLKRTLFEISVLKQSQVSGFSRGKVDARPFWGRRSVFSISKRQLLVGEIFLPSCPPL